MVERTYMTPCGNIHYWVNKTAEKNKAQLVFLPGLTADHYFCPVLPPITGFLINK